MIAKGNQRGGGGHLATHLMNDFDNEQVSIVDIRDAAAPDLHGAFAEWAAMSTQTRCKKYLYSLSINPDPAQPDLTDEQITDYIHRIEEKLGLVDQPRAIVSHEKEGRSHFHVVWSRIDAEKLIAVHMSHDHQKIRSVTRQFALDNSIELPSNLRNDRGLDRFNDVAKYGLSEKQQQDRTGLTKADHVTALTAAFNGSDNGSAFLGALEASGYLLAHGDKDNTYVVVDEHDEIHPLVRRIEGARKKQVHAKLKNHPPEKLPHYSKAKDFFKSSPAALRTKLKADFETKASSMQGRLTKNQKIRRDKLAGETGTITTRQETETTALLNVQQENNDQNRRLKLSRQPRPIIATLLRITGIQKLKNYFNQAQAQRRQSEQKEERLSLKRRHNAELEDQARKGRALDAIDKYERRSLETRLLRQNRLTQKQLSETTRETPATGSKSPATKTITKTQADKKAAFRETAETITRPAESGAKKTKKETVTRGKAGSGDQAPAPDQQEKVSDFTEAAETFTRGKKPVRKKTVKKTSKERLEDKGQIKEGFAKHADGPARITRDLSDKEKAEQKRKEQERIEKAKKRGPKGPDRGGPGGPGL